ncbi:MAG TPA: DUF5709 domain-containing protein [Phycicoccus sp.]|nr:DUF5709 domain-containing protein [Phycicoccus sp.]
MTETPIDPEGADLPTLAQWDSLDTLDTDPVTDPLDTGYSPPDTARGSRAFGTTAWEQRHHETIDQRILQEVPDPTSAYGAPHNESGLDGDSLGGDDPDAVGADLDWIGDAEVGWRRSGRLVAPDAGAGEDREHDLVGADVGIDGGAAAAEEAAVHVIGDDYLDDEGFREGSASPSEDDFLADIADDELSEVLAEEFAERTDGVPHRASTRRRPGQPLPPQ